MTIRIRGRRIAAAAALPLSLAIVVAACATTDSRDPAGTASPPPSAAPASPAAPTASPIPSSSPMPPVGVTLDVATPHQVSVIVDDATGRVDDVASGRAGDGMSVRWGDSIVENVDDQTIRVTWVGLPLDEELHLQVAGRPGDRIGLAFTQAAPPANSDAIGFDRVLVVRFDGPIDAGSVDVTFEQAADY